MCSTRIYQVDGVVGEVPQFVPSILESTKQLGTSFAYDASKIWNDIPGDVSLATSVFSFRKKLVILSLCKKHTNPRLCYFHPAFSPQ